MFTAKFWGVRGSIPCPGPETVVFGGNTACIELRIEDRLFIIDAGSGIRSLGNELMSHLKETGPVKASLFITHTHWDHIMGFPFFVPIFIPGTELDIYGPVTYEDETLEDIVGGQLRYRYFPVNYSELGGTLRYHPLKECRLDLGDGIVLTTKYLNHPILCLGYKFEYKGKSFCTAYDTEPFINVFDVDRDSEEFDEAAFEEGKKIVQEQQENFRQFISGTDVLVYDSQYTRKEYKQGKIGWGHTPFEDAVNIGQSAEVKNLVLFHHEPTRNDEELKKIEHLLSSKIAGKSTMKVQMAQEGKTISL